jgi:hypothetical protein
VFLDGDILPDNMLTNFAVDDAHFLGVLSSRIHVVFALAAGGTLEDRPRYNKTVCFEPFPFPVCDNTHKARIRALAEQLDAHRKRQQAINSKLTLTDMYNVLEKLRSREELTAKEKVIHEQGLVSVLRQIHDDLDAAVFAAYGWPATLSDDEILERLVALNAERAAEEAQGLVRWLRPEFQNPGGAGAKQQGLSLVEDEEAGARRGKRAVEGAGAGLRQAGSLSHAPGAGTAKNPWPKGRAAQAKAVLAALRECPAPVTPEELAQRFTRAHRETLDELLQALVALGQARRTRGGKYVG